MHILKLILWLYGWSLRLLGFQENGEIEPCTPKVSIDGDYFLI